VKLYRTLNEQKERLVELQIKQRMAEIEKKREMFHDYWNQTIKPKNKLLDVGFQELVLNEEQIVRSGAMVWNLERPKTALKDESDSFYDA